MNKLNQFYYDRLKEKSFDVAMERYERTHVLEISNTLCGRLNEAASFLGIEQQNCSCGACVEILCTHIWPLYKEFGGVPSVVVEAEAMNIIVEPEPEQEPEPVKKKRNVRRHKK